MLVSAVMPIMSIYQLPQDQYGYSGHVINLPQDVASFSNTLPQLPSKLDGIVRKEGTDKSHRHFHVRRSVVHRALQWLVMYNKYYRPSNVCIDGNTLDQLPDDGNLVQLRGIAIDSPTMDSPTSTASTSTSSSSPITSTSPDNVILTAIPVLLTRPTIHIVPTFLSCLFLQPCGQ